MKSFLKKINIKLIVLIVIVFVGTVGVIFNEFGLLKFLRLQKEVNSINVDIKKEMDENKSLRNGIDSLERKVPAKIEKSAREKYGMIRKGEKSIQVIEK
jgi:cell division protein FtsB